MKAPSIHQGPSADAPASMPRMKAPILHLPGARLVVNEHGCWIWQGVRSDQGYGYLNINGRRHYAHRVAYQLFNGPIPRGHEIDHVCHNDAAENDTCDGGICEHRACCNPAHLECVTSRENSRRGNHPLHAAARRKTCARGHDLTVEANVYVNPNSGRRRCRICTHDRQRERRADTSKP